jgi:hypothetical protein
LSRSGSGAHRSEFTAALSSAPDPFQREARCCELADPSLLDPLSSMCDQRCASLVRRCAMCPLCRVSLRRASASRAFEAQRGNISLRPHHNPRGSSYIQCALWTTVTRPVETTPRVGRSAPPTPDEPVAELSIGSIVASMLFTHIRYFYRLDRDGPRNSSILLR